MKLRTCVHPEGRFLVGIHRPKYVAENVRKEQRTPVLGVGPNGDAVTGTANFPEGPVNVDDADWIYEIANPFSFRGATFTSRYHADRAAADPDTIRIPPRPTVSLNDWLAERPHGQRLDAPLRTTFIGELPEAMQLALAAVTTDPADLTALADVCCEFIRDPATGRPTGLSFEKNAEGRRRPRVLNDALFEIVGNNAHLPDDYKRAMVLRPGVQGGSEIVGDWRDDMGRTHVYEYLRGNSYIPWGHYAANMADDAVRYHARDISLSDMKGMRHLYYQRTLLRLGEAFGEAPFSRRSKPALDELESLRGKILCAIDHGDRPRGKHFTGTLWGWNYGFDFAPTGYRLHASHQQVHQQYALIAATVSGVGGDRQKPFACGDLVADFVQRYREETGADFFEAYAKAVDSNRRTDGNPDGAARLVVFEDAQVMLFVPKAQTSQWELQLMPKGPIGNVLEADTDMRASLDRALWVAIRVLTGLGAEMVTTIEFSKRFDAGETGQRLLYSLLPRLPFSPGAFSEAQLRWVNRHYPEDFAECCRRELAASGIT